MGTTHIRTVFSFVKLVNTIRTLSFDQASLSNMGSKGSHITQNNTLLAPSTKQRKKEGKRVTLQAKVNELEAQNNKIAMKNGVLQKQYEKLLRRSMKLCVLKHASSLPLWTSTIIWVPPNTEGHLPLTWVSLMRSELIIKTLINIRLLST
ncbi:hypothetical protein ACFX16_013216 [Malus domestica]